MFVMASFTQSTISPRAASPNPHARANDSSSCRTGARFAGSRVTRKRRDAGTAGRGDAGTRRGIRSPRLRASASGRHRCTSSLPLLQPLLPTVHCRPAVVRVIIKTIIERLARDALQGLDGIETDGGVVVIELGNQ